MSSRHTPARGPAPVHPHALALTLAAARVGELLGADEKLLTVSAITVSDQGEMLVTAIHAGREPTRSLITDPGRALREAQDLQREAVVDLSPG